MIRLNLCGCSFSSVRLISVALNNIKRCVLKLTKIMIEKVIVKWRLMIFNDSIVVVVPTSIFAVSFSFNGTLLLLTTVLRLSQPIITLIYQRNARRKLQTLIFGYVEKLYVNQLLNYCKNSCKIHLSVFSLPFIFFLFRILVSVDSAD